MRIAAVAYAVFVVVYCCFPALAQPPPTGRLIENAGGTTGVDTAGDALTFTCSGFTCGKWSSNLGESLLTAFGEAGQTGAIIQVQEDGGDLLSLGHDGGNFAFIVSSTQGVDVEVGGAGHGLRIHDPFSATVLDFLGGTGLLRGWSWTPGPSSAGNVVVRTCGDQCLQFSLDNLVTDHLKIELTQTTVTGELGVTDTVTGALAGTHICIDANNQLCVCGSCA